MARRDKQREAGRRYQQSRCGRLHHANRARRYRDRHKKVTHQGSALLPSAVLLAKDLAAAISTVVQPSHRLIDRCHKCGCPCEEFVRYNFLRRRPVPERMSPLTATQRRRQ